MKQITGAGSLDELAGLLAVLAGTAGQKFGCAHIRSIQTGSFFVSVCPCCVQEVVGLLSSEVSRDSRTCRAAARARLHVLYFTKYLLDKLQFCHLYRYGVSRVCVPAPPVSFYLLCRYRNHPT